MSEKGDRYRSQAAEAIAVRQSGSLSMARKMMHVALAIVPFAGWLVSFELALAMALGLAVVSLAVEGARRGWPGVNRLPWRLLHQPTHRRRIYKDSAVESGFGETALILPAS